MCLEDLTQVAECYSIDENLGSVVSTLGIPVCLHF